MVKNFERAVSVISLVVGLSSIAVSVYLSKITSAAAYLMVSGWIFAAIITFLIGVLAFRVVGSLEDEVLRAKDEVVAAKDEAVKYKNDLAAQTHEMNTYRNISVSLSSMINPDPIKSSIRSKLASHFGMQGDKDD